MAVELKNHVSADVLEKELALVKKELISQLNMREKELKEYNDLQKRYVMLEKRYAAITRSFLGKVTLKYWRLRRKLSNKNVSKGNAK
ncbi:hypothetical protein ACFX4Y_13905 [Priestia sp. YIM B13446]|uniref:hypothetical protein n=1 Tax=Priestia TaxID=2800373 RepID=UPI000BF87015|nr:MULTISPECIES: hypothetical protein [Priestia]MCM3095073.1 hypothetical protein [Priestia megaterium]MCM3792171.1 hypothetical protein [Priestia megaterium]MCP1450478.1 hypothetical protein [Priestia megaterium]MDE8675342.1 hypothetical protein [Priestia aryabhattai]MED4000936.1 hypothetical protein [Priestia aryabhattai]